MNMSRTVLAALIGAEYIWLGETSCWKLAQRYSSAVNDIKYPDRVKGLVQEWWDLRQNKLRKTCMRFLDWEGHAGKINNVQEMELDPMQCTSFYRLHSVIFRNSGEMLQWPVAIFSRKAKAAHKARGKSRGPAWERKQGNWGYGGISGEEQSNFVETKNAPLENRDIQRFLSKKKENGFISLLPGTWVAIL